MGLKILSTVLEEDLKVPDLCCAYLMTNLLLYYFVLLDCFPFSLCFLISLITFILSLIIFYRQEAGGRHEWGGLSQEGRRGSCLVPLHFSRLSSGLTSLETSLEQGILLLCPIMAHILQVLSQTLPSPGSSGRPRGLVGERLEGRDILEPEHLSPPSAFKGSSAVAFWAGLRGSSLARSPG